MTPQEYFEDIMQQLIDQGLPAPIAEIVAMGIVRDEIEKERIKRENIKKFKMMEKINLN